MDKPDKDGDKESIEEILSDLNSLLNRMPAILSDIKMPETRPVDFSRIRREAETQPPPPSEPERAAETIRLEPEEMDGIAASAHIMPDPDPEPGPQPDFSGEEYNFDFAPEPPPAAPAPAPLPVPAPETPEKPEDSFEQSGDFGAPDIDALLHLSASGEDAISTAEEKKDQGGEMEEKRQDDQERPAEDIAGAAPSGEAVPEQPAAEVQPSPDQFPAFEATIKMDSPFEFQEPAAAAAAPEGDAAGGESPVPSGDDLKAFESAFVIPPSDDATPPEPPPAETPAVSTPAELSVPEVLSIEQQFQVPEPGLQAAPGQETAAPAADIQPGGISLEPQFSMPEEPAVPAPEQPSSAAEPALSVGGPQLAADEPQLSVGSPAPQAGGLSLEPRSDTPFGPSTEAAEEKTVVFGPGQAIETPGGGETLVYQGGDASATSRMRAEASLPELAAMEPPATVDPSRIKTLAFMYASGEEKFCADVLATLDAICLKSESRPMFIKRAFVRPCGDDMRGAMAQQMVSEAGASGLICVGAVAQEALYDIENAFGSSGSFFRHFSRDGFGMTSALDSVLDLILKP